MLFRTQNLPRRLTALLLALVLFAPASSFGRLLYSCGMTGRVTAGACCCHRAKVKAQQAELAGGPRPAAQVETPGCCRVDDNRRAAAPVSLSLTDTTVLAASAVAFVPAFEPQPLRAADVSWLARSSRGPPPTSVFVTNCSLLL
jgi:hypothetical protein